MTLIVKDNKSTYAKYFGEILDFCNRVRAEGLALVDDRQWLLFCIPEPQDMKSHHLCMGRDGAAKCPGVVFFSPLYMCISNNIVVLNQVQCLTCLEHGRLCCYNYDIIDKRTVTADREELMHLEGGAMS
jgi:hypothetical protein